MWKILLEIGKHASKGAGVTERRTEAIEFESSSVEAHRDADVDTITLGGYVSSVW